MLRRKFLKTAGGVLVAGSSALVRPARATEMVMPGTTCRPTARQTEGPYLTPDSPLRSDIREDNPGVPLHITLNVIDDFWCTPIEGAAVDIWHTDALGRYSGVLNEFFDLATLRLNGESLDLRGTSFMRGHQISDAAGRVEFTTVYPGWYAGRLAHIHLRTIIAGLAWTSHVTQLYFPPDIEHDIYESETYRERGQNPLGIDRDFVIRGDSATIAELTLPLVKDGDGFRGEFDLTVTF